MLGWVDLVLDALKNRLDETVRKQITSTAPGQAYC